MYADTRTDSIHATLQETDRRRRLQLAYNQKYSITPTSIRKNITSIMHSASERDYARIPAVEEPTAAYGDQRELQRSIERLKKQMQAASKKLEFEKAAELRDQLFALERQQLDLSDA